jgi:hypothetical protein
MKSALATLTCFAVTSHAHAENLGLEVSLLSELSTTTSAFIMLKAPDFYGIAPGVEYGQRLYWATTAKGEWEGHNVVSYGLNVSGEKSISQDYSFNASLAVGLTRIHGRRTTDGANDWRDEDSVYSDIRFGVSSTASENFVPEIGVNILSHYLRYAMLIDGSNAFVPPQDVGVYAKLGYRF